MRQHMLDHITRNSGDGRAPRPAFAVRRHARRLVPGISAIALAVALGLPGCTVGPNFQGPPTAGVDSYLPRKLEAAAARNAGAKLSPGANIPGDWWRVLGSPRLSELIETGLAHNSDLAAAEAALRSAEASMLAAKGAFFPTVQLNWNSSRQLTPYAALASNAASGNPLYSLHTPQVQVTYLADVFGSVRRAVEAGDAQAEALWFQREAVALTVASNIALAAVSQASFEGQIAATKRLIAAQTELLGILRKMQEAGQIALTDVLVQETAAAQAKLLLPPLERQREQQANAIAVLTGRFPGAAERAQFTLKNFRKPLNIPVSVPADLARQRPDVRMAESNLRAANAQVGVAIAARLPQLTLSANGGSTAEAISRLFSSGTWFYLIAGNAVQTVFDGRTLEMKQRAAEETFIQQTEQYKSTLLQAAQNVADTMLALEADVRTLKAAREAERAAKKSLDLIRTQLREGQVSITTLIPAQQAYLQTAIATVQAEASQLADTIALYQALGGGWWNRHGERDPATVRALFDQHAAVPPGTPDTIKKE